jgi:hypothetical protein
MSYLRSIPPYPGSKRRLLPAIFGLVDSVCPRSSWASLVFADPFLGSGSVSLTAKALAFKKVVANDIAEQSAVVGRALVANCRVRLTPSMVLRLYEPAPPIDCQPPRLLDRFPVPHREFLERAWRHLYGATFAGIERDLIALLLLKWIFRYFPLGLPGATDAHRVVGGDFDSVTPQRLAHYLGRGRGLLQPSNLLAVAQEINRGIMPGHAQFFQTDVFAFLPAIKADVVYLDPPYPNTQSYEHAFALVDEFLGQEPAPTSAFSSKKPPLDDLLDACRHIPVLVLSMGNALLDEDGVHELVRRHRQVRRVITLPCRHYGAVASQEKNSVNRELLVLATLT